jgi:tetratricopeptide (TPR) repeat protein
LKGEAAQKKGDLKSAITNFSEAIRLDPKLVTAYNNRGLVYYEKHELDKAIADFNEAIRLDPKLTSAYGHRADAYEDKGNPPLLTLGPSPRDHEYMAPGARGAFQLPTDNRLTHRS